MCDSRSRRGEVDVQDARKGLQELNQRFLPLENAICDLLRDSGGELPISNNSHGPASMPQVSQRMCREAFEDRQLQFRREIDQGLGCPLHLYVTVVNTISSDLKMASVDQREL